MTLPAHVLTQTKGLDGGILGRRYTQPIVNTGSGDQGRFATTPWSLVLAAARIGAADPEGLARLFSPYWYPVFAFVRRQGHSAYEAHDLTQGFFSRLFDGLSGLLAGRDDE